MSLIIANANQTRHQQSSSLNNHDVTYLSSSQHEKEHCLTSASLKGHMQLIKGLSGRFSRPGLQFPSESMTQCPVQFIVDQTTQETHTFTNSYTSYVRRMWRPSLQSVMSREQRLKKMKMLRIQIYHQKDYCPSDGNSSYWFGRYHPRNTKHNERETTFFIVVDSEWSLLSRTTISMAHMDKKARGEEKIRQGWVWSYVHGRHIL